MPQLAAAVAGRPVKKSVTGASSAQAAPLAAEMTPTLQSRTRSAARKAATSSDPEPKKSELANSSVASDEQSSQCAATSSFDSSTSNLLADEPSEGDSHTELQSDLSQSYPVTQNDIIASIEDGESKCQESHDNVLGPQSDDDDDDDDDEDQEESSSDEESEDASDADQSDNDLSDDDQSDEDSSDDDQSDDEAKDSKSPGVPGNLNTGDNTEDDPDLKRYTGPFPKVKSVIQNVLSHFMPEDRLVTLATQLRNGRKHAGLVDSFSAEDKKLLRDLVSLVSANSVTYCTFGGQAFRMLRFEFVKTTAVRGLLTAHREWESTNGLPTLLQNIKTITIHQSFKQPFLEWVSDLALLEEDDGGNEELNGLLEVVFTEMPADRDIEVAGSRYMPSAMEKLRAILPKLKKRKLNTWIVEGEADEDKRVVVRLISNNHLQHNLVGLKDDEIVLDPSHEMSLYRKALARNNKNQARIKQENTARRMSAGLPSVSPKKEGKKRPSPSQSLQIKKSPKKASGVIRKRRQSDDPDLEYDHSSDSSRLEHEMSRMSVEGPSPSNSADLAYRALFSNGALHVYRDRFRHAVNQHEKNQMRQALHDELDELLEDCY